MTIKIWLIVKLKIKNCRITPFKIILQAIKALKKKNNIFSLMANMIKKLIKKKEISINFI
jgi:hypothetical protein